MSEETRTTIVRNISVDPETDAIIERKAVELAKVTGDRPNYSAAVRALVRESDAAKPDTRKAKATA